VNTSIFYGHRLYRFVLTNIKNPGHIYNIGILFNTILERCSLYDNEPFFTGEVMLARFKPPFVPVLFYK
jgi:hypothetical protein